MNPISYEPTTTQHPVSHETFTAFIRANPNLAGHPVVGVEFGIMQYYQAGQPNKVMATAEYRTVPGSACKRSYYLREVV